MHCFCFVRFAAAYQATQHPDFSKLAARISVSNMHKETEKAFSKVIEQFHKHVHPKTGFAAPLVADDVYQIVMDHADELNAAIIYDRDFEYDYFGYKTLERSYLTKIDGKIAERPQHMIMRVAVGIHKNDIAAALETYELMSKKYFTHASPTLFNAGTPRPQLSSCFLLTMKEDSIEGIYDTLKQCACISKYAGGIGLSVHPIRASESYIRSTNGNSNGIVPMLRVFNNTARFVQQGGGKVGVVWSERCTLLKCPIVLMNCDVCVYVCVDIACARARVCDVCVCVFCGFGDGTCQRKASFAIYLEPWHAGACLDYLNSNVLLSQFI